MARIEAALPRVMAIEILCRSHSTSLLLPVFPFILLPNSAINLSVCFPYTPVVLKAIGTKRYLSWRDAYLSTLDFSALDAVAPGLCAASLMDDKLKVSQHVASQHKLLPSLKGKTVIPSGLVALSALRPEGSRIEGTPAVDNDRFMMSFSCA